MRWFIIYVIFLAVIVIFISSGKKSRKVKISEEISSKYKEMAYNLIKGNDRLNAQRSRYNFLVLIKGLLFIAMFGSFIYFMYAHTFILVFVPIACIIGIIIINKSNKSNIIFDEILPDIIKKQFNDFNYNHNSGISRGTYCEARFEGFDRYHSDDLIEGKVCGSDFVMSEVHTERESRDSEGHTTYITVFRGAFAKVNLNKDLGCFINIINNKIKLFSRDYYTTIDNEAFEKIYDVFTDDKIKTLRLLTPDVTTKMIDLYNETGIYCEVKINNNLLYIRLYTGALFSFSFSNPEKESLMVGRSLAVIDSVFKIMENFIKEVEEFDV